MSKVSIIAKITTKPETEEKFLEQWDAIITHVKDKPDIEHYALHRSNCDPSTFYVMEIYSSKEAFDAHSTSEAFTDFLGSIHDFVHESDIQMLTPVKA